MSRRHWELVKFGFVSAVTVVAAAVYGLGMSWWMTPLSETGQLGRSRFTVFFFDMQGVAPIGYTVFAVALGIFAGTIWPRVLPAMGVVLVGFIGLRIALTTLARPRYMPARSLTVPLQSAGGSTPEPHLSAGDWVVASGARDASGTPVEADVATICPPDADAPGAGCGTNLGVGPGAYSWQLYQPGSRYWIFQGIETGIFVVLAAVLLYLAIRRIRRIA